MEQSSLATQSREKSKPGLGGPSAATWMVLSMCSFLARVLVTPGEPSWQAAPLKPSRDSGATSAFPRGGGSVGSHCSCAASEGGRFHTVRFLFL